MACVVAAALLSAAAIWLTRGQADDKPVKAAAADKAEIDALIEKGLKASINHGTDLYNLNKDYAGCYHVYEGALLTVYPMLEHRPELQKSIEAALGNARNISSYVERSWALREVLDQVRKEVNPNKGEAAKDKDEKDKKDKPADKKDADKDKPADKDKKDADKDKKDADKKDADKDKKDADKKPKDGEAALKDKDAKDKDAKDKDAKDKDAKDKDAKDKDAKDKDAKDKDKDKKDADKDKKDAKDKDK
jgi:hypothetical protein